MLLRALPPLRAPSFSHSYRTFRTTSIRNDFHFDTHHFVQRLEREGLNRAQAEGIMSAMAEVIDESIRNMTSNMVTKTDHEKVQVSRHHHARLPTRDTWGVATIYTACRLCSTQIRAPAE